MGHERGIVYLKLRNITFYKARGLKPSPGISNKWEGLSPLGLQIGGLKPPPVRGFEAPPHWSNPGYAPEGGLLFKLVY